MDYLEQRKLIRSATRINLLTNRLVMIAPVSSKARFELAPGLALASMLGRDRLAMADPDSVPAGKYGKAALEALGLWRSIADRLARVENVRACLLLVARDEAPLGIVYRTDAIADPKVRIVAEFAARLHPPIVYPVAMTATSKSPAAMRLLQFAGTPAARAVWARHGFLPP
jgi:molybdate transport system substrate-binding protein